LLKTLSVKSEPLENIVSLMIWFSSYPFEKHFSLDLVENCTGYLLKKIEIKTLKTDRVILYKEGIKNRK
jgi:hypothetical protein